jgi:ABC-type transport system substrate-binding protein
MTDMVHLAIADDVTEAEEIQADLADAGIDSELQPVEEADSVAVLVPESKLEDAEDLLAAMADESLPE